MPAKVGEVVNQMKGLELEEEMEISDWLEFRWKNRQKWQKRTFSEIQKGFYEERLALEIVKKE